MRVMLLACSFVACFALLPAARADDKDKPAELPGGNGPVYQYVGKTGVKVTSADVAARYEDMALGKPPRSRTLRADVKKLEFSISFAKKPPAIELEIHDAKGKVDVKWAEVFSHVENLQTGAYYFSTHCDAPTGKFAPGPYQAKVKLDGQVVALINWQIGAANPAAGKPDPGAAKNPDDKKTEPTSDDEARATFKLDSAKSLIKNGKKDKAREYCEEIITKYPTTKSAGEAKELLKELKK